VNFSENLPRQWFAECSLSFCVVICGMETFNISTEPVYGFDVPVYSFDTEVVVICLIDMILQSCEEIWC
jgi:hypothetical protein